MPIKGHIGILIATIISVVAFAADSKHGRRQQGALEVHDANGNLAERLRDVSFTPKSGHGRRT
jgi:hypothetical protein